MDGRENDHDGITRAMLFMDRNLLQGKRPTQASMLTPEDPQPWARGPAARGSKSITSTGTCRLLALPAELRELIWIHTVTEWTPALAYKHDKQVPSTRRSSILEQRPIRMDRLNRPLPPAITRVSHQLRAETLPLYYQENIFECWRPLYWVCDWSASTLINWLDTLSDREIIWLRHIVLLYKNEDELQYDVAIALVEQGYELGECDITSKLELSEYEQCFEQLGLPRHFGKKKRFDRWGASHTSAS